ncbi:helix-turn-helix domain-containing protein, partial [Kyrpidia sp.]
LSVYNQKYGRKVQFHPDVMPYFLTYPWPGNIRELQNIVERLVVTCSEPLIRPERLPDKLRHYDGPEEGAANKSLKELVEEFERNIIHNAMQRYKTMKEVSEHLKVDVSTISRKARKYGIRHGSSNL